VCTCVFAEEAELEKDAAAAEGAVERDTEAAEGDTEETLAKRRMYVRYFSWPALGKWTAAALAAVLTVAVAVLEVSHSNPPVQRKATHESRRTVL
jgi:hypothetical protein